MKFSWNEAAIWLSLLGLTVSMSAVFISDYAKIDSWSIPYFGTGLSTIAIFIIILKFKKINEKANG